MVDEAAVVKRRGNSCYRRAHHDGHCPGFRKIQEKIVRHFYPIQFVFSQYNVLRVLDALPNSRGSITEISKLLLVSTPNLSGIAKRLEKAGFIIRSRDESDERRTILKLQPTDRRVLTKIRRLQETNIKMFLAACPVGQKRALLDLLRGMLKFDGGAIELKIGFE